MNILGFLYSTTVNWASLVCGQNQTFEDGHGWTCFTFSKQTTHQIIKIKSAMKIIGSCSPISIKYRHCLLAKEGMFWFWHAQTCMDRNLLTHTNTHTHTHTHTNTFLPAPPDLLSGRRRSHLLWRGPCCSWEACGGILVGPSERRCSVSSPCTCSLWENKQKGND